MQLPNGERADLGRKIEGYTLNPEHPVGKHKARVFAAALGLTMEDAVILRAAVLEAAAQADDAVPKGDNGYGRVYELRFPLSTAKGRAMVFTAWIIRHNEDFPRLATCYIL